MASTSWNDVLVSAGTAVVTGVLAGSNFVLAVVGFGASHSGTGVAALAMTTHTTTYITAAKALAIGSVAPWAIFALSIALAPLVLGAVRKSGGFQRVWGNLKGTASRILNTVSARPMAVRL